jgi:hypothetical protein
VQLKAVQMKNITEKQEKEIRELSKRAIEFDRQNSENGYLVFSTSEIIFSEDLNLEEAIYFSASSCYIKNQKDLKKITEVMQNALILVSDLRLEVKRILSN